MGKALNLGKLAVKARPSHWEQQAAAMPSHSTLMLSPVAVSSTACRTLPIPILFAKPAISGKLKQASPRKAEATAKSKQEQRLGCQSFTRWTLNFACLKREQNRDQSLFLHCFHICLADALMQEAEPDGMKENPVTSSLLGLH